jgi:hypothetical protein
MQFSTDNRFLAVLFSVVLHGVVLSLASDIHLRFNDKPDTPEPKKEIVFLEAFQPPAEKKIAAPAEHTSVTYKSPTAASTIQVGQATPKAPPLAQRLAASQDAPPAPTTQEWAFAAKYTLKNSKGYRYNWGQQVRSMMGTAFEGADQGFVRFRVEIAPDGTLAKLETLWTTSTAAEQLARKAIQNMPPLPATPTGKPLIFEKTISFSPFAKDGPPTYKDDCLPDPPVFRNPFAWDGKSPHVIAQAKPVEKLDPQAMEECLKQLPRDTIEAESAQDRRLLDQWGSTKTGQ